MLRIQARNIRKRALLHQITFKPITMKKKTSFHLLLVTVLLFVFATLSNLSFAQQLSVGTTIKAEQVSVEISQPDNNYLKFKLTVLNPLIENLTINLIDKQSGVLSTKSFNSSNYQLIYDMREVPDGVYSFEITGSGEKIVRELTINTIIKESREVSINNKKKLNRKLGF